MTRLSLFEYKDPRLIISLFTFLILVFSMSAIAAPEASEQLNWLQMGMELLGGLALFLFGMEQMSDGLKAAAGDNMKTLLSKLTKNRFSAAITGAIVTAVIQSSSVTTVLVVGFVSAGLMTMVQSIGVIMGANIGTTITAQIVAFKVEKAALLMIAVGFAMLFLSKKDRVQQYGNMLMGLGLVFFGMGIMSEGMSPLRSYEPFIELMASMEQPILGILVAAAFTALVQSSSATTGIVIVMASQGFITLPAGIALAFGANIGTCITAVLAAIGKPTEAKRAAAVHIFFNVAGVTLWLFFIPQLANIVMDISPVAKDVTGTARLAAEVPRQIANAHTIFNIANTILFIGFTTQIARLVERLVPESAEAEKAIIKAKYLDDELIETPALALDRVRLELGHLAEITEDMLVQVRQAFENRSHENMDEVAKLDDQADIIHGEISEYMKNLTLQPLTEKDNESLMYYLMVNEELERVGDVIETNLVAIGHNVIDSGAVESEAVELVMQKLYDKTKSSLLLAKQAIVDSDELAAQEVIHMKDEINKYVQEVLQLQAKRLDSEGAENISITQFENDVMDAMKRIYSLTKRIAKLSVPESVVKEPT